REPLAHTGRVVTEVAAHHVLAGRADHVPLDVVGDPVPEPERQGAHPRAACELGHQRVARADGRREVADEGLKELLPGVARGPLRGGRGGGMAGGRGPVRACCGSDPWTCPPRDGFMSRRLCPGMPGTPPRRLVLTLGTLPPRSRRPQRQGGQRVVQAATTALGEVAGDSPAKSAPAANGCKAAATPAALTKRPVGSFASIRSRTAPRP